MADSWLMDVNCSNCRRKNELYNDVMNATGMGQLLDRTGIRERFEDNMKSKIS